LKLFDERASTKGLDLAAYVAPRVPAVIEGDPVRCHQILSNLVNNALKFTQSGGILVRLDSSGLDAIGRTILVMSVSDTDIGIPAIKLPTIFEAFSQADQSTTREYGGTGIDLTICQRLATAMGGTIGVTSIERSGSTFTVRILVVSIQEPSNNPKPVTPKGRIVIALPEGQTRSVLIQYARDDGFSAVPISPKDLTDDAMANAVAVLGEADTLSMARAKYPGVMAAERRFTIVVLSRFGATRSGNSTEGRDFDLPLELPASSSDISASFATMRAGSAALAERGAGKSAGIVAAEVLPDYSGVQVLAADDSALNRELLVEALTRFGIRVTCVADGRAAFDAIQTGRLEMAFMDGSMPVMDGFEASRAVRAWEERHGHHPSPIVALTAHVIGPQAEMRRMSGMTEHHKTLHTEGTASVP
jgi:CheY-like chemotaxis protein